MQAAAMGTPASAQSRSACIASATSLRCKAWCSGSGILWPMAGTMTQSGVGQSATASTGTPINCELRTCGRTPAMLTWYCGPGQAYKADSSLAVVNASSTVASPVSKTLSSTKMVIFMAQLIPKLSIVPLCHVPSSP